MTQHRFVACTHARHAQAIVDIFNEAIVTSTALYDYQAVIDEEFDFKSGDVIAVTATPEDGWWSGTLHDTARAQSGRHIFPSNFVRRMRPEFAPCHKEEQ